MPPLPRLCLCLVDGDADGDACREAIAAATVFVLLATGEDCAFACRRDVPRGFTNVPVPARRRGPADRVDDDPTSTPPSNPTAPGGFCANANILSRAFARASPSTCTSDATPTARWPRLLCRCSSGSSNTTTTTRGDDDDDDDDDAVIVGDADDVRAGLGTCDSATRSPICARLDQNAPDSDMSSHWLNQRTESNNSGRGGAMEQPPKHLFNQWHPVWVQHASSHHAAATKGVAVLGPFCGDAPARRKLIELKTGHILFAHMKYVRCCQWIFRDVAPEQATSILSHCFGPELPSPP